jgi:hypothetical protein
MKQILLPIFNRGQAYIFGAMLILYISIAIFVDVLLGIYLGIGAYAGIIIYSLVAGLAPDQAEIYPHEIGAVSSFLDKEPFVVSIGDMVWAPRMSRSPLFESDWISIKEVGGRVVLQARKRDIKVILSEIRRPVP